MSSLTDQEPPSCVGNGSLLICYIAFIIRQLMILNTNHPHHLSMIPVS